MMPTIRVDDDVFNGLKSLAEPFVDTPNTVIRRLLQEKAALERRVDSSSPPDRGTPSEGASSSLDSRATQPLCEMFLLFVLAREFGGMASKHDATRRAVELMQARGLVGGDDLRRVSSGETKVENTIAWGRNALKERGLISRDSKKGIWQLTKEGMQQGKEVELPK